MFWLKRQWMNMLEAQHFCKCCTVVRNKLCYVPNKIKTFKAYFNFIMYKILLLQRFKNTKWFAMNCTVTVEFIISLLASLWCSLPYITSILWHKKGLERPLCPSASTCCPLSSVGALFPMALVVMGLNCHTACQQLNSVADEEPSVQACSLVLFY